MESQSTCKDTNSAETPEKIEILSIIPGDNGKDCGELPLFASWLSDRTGLFTLRVGSQELSIVAHSEILSKLPFFQAACKGGFKEAKERIIRLPEDNPYAIGVLIEYLYTDRWMSFMAAPARKGSAEATEQDDELVRLYAQRLIQVSVIANKYNCEGLEKDAYRKFQAYFAKPGLLYRQLYEAWKVIYKYTAPGSPLRFKYSDNDKEKWEEYGRSLQDHKKWFTDIRNSMGDRAIERMFIEYPELGYDIYTVLIQK